MSNPPPPILLLPISPGHPLPPPVQITSYVTRPATDAEEASLARRAARRLRRECRRLNAELEWTRRDAERRGEVLPQDQERGAIERDRQAAVDKLRAHARDLEERNAGLERELTALQSSASATECAQPVLAKEVEEGRLVTAGLERGTSALGEHLEDARRRCDELQGRNRVLERDICGVRRENGELQEERRRVERELTDVRSENGELERGNMKLGQTNGELERRNTELAREVEDMRRREMELGRQVEDARRLDTDLEGDNEAVRIQAVDLERDKSSAWAEVVELGREKLVAAERASDLERDNLAANIRVSVLEQKCTKLQTDHDNMTRQMYHTKDEKRDADIRAASLEQQVADLNQRAAALESELHACRVTMQTPNLSSHTSPALDTLRTENSSLFQQLRSLEAENKHLNHNLSLLETEIKELSHQLGSLQEETTSLTTSLTSSNHALSEERHFAAKIQTACTTLLRDNRALRNHLLSIRGTFRTVIRLLPPPTISTYSSNPLSVFWSIAPLSPLLTKLTLNIPRATSQGKQKPTTHAFTFDCVFGPDDREEEVYNEFAGVLDAAREGRRVVIIAYGRSGTGKTYIMRGLMRWIVERGVKGMLGGSATEGASEGKTESEREATTEGDVDSSEHSFSTTLSPSPASAFTSPSSTSRPTHSTSDAQSKASSSSCTPSSSRHRLHLTYTELRPSDNLYDLLATPPKPLPLPASPSRSLHPPYSAPATSIPITSTPQLLSLLAEADARRATASTKLNALSSRSHAFISLAFHVPPVPSAPQSPQPRPHPYFQPPPPGQAQAGGQREEMYGGQEGRLTFVDLAGSERESELAESSPSVSSSASPSTAANDTERWKETTWINMGLSSLKTGLIAVAERAERADRRRGSGVVGEGKKGEMSLEGAWLRGGGLGRLVGGLVCPPPTTTTACSTSTTQGGSGGGGAGAGAGAGAQTQETIVVLLGTVDCNAKEKLSGSVETLKMVAEAGAVKLK